MSGGGIVGTAGTNASGFMILDWTAVIVPIGPPAPFPPVLQIQLRGSYSLQIIARAEDFSSSQATRTVSASAAVLAGITAAEGPRMLYDEEIGTFYGCDSRDPDCEVRPRKAAAPSLVTLARPGFPITVRQLVDLQVGAPPDSGAFGMYASADPVIEFVDPGDAASYRIVYSDTAFGQLPGQPGPIPRIVRAVAEDEAIVLELDVDDADRPGILIWSAHCSGSNGAFTAMSVEPEVRVTGLANDIAYTCTATTTNLNGEGQSSVPTEPITPEAPPQSLPIWLLVLPDREEARER